MIRAMLVVAALGLVAAAVTIAAPPVDVVSTRELCDINWMEFKEVVPAKVDTVILPTGTLEPHGVINNGADITAPVAIARQIAHEVNAMVAPVIPYGITGSMDAFPGAFSISEAAYRAYVRDVLTGLARTRFRTIIIVNGHGGPQTAVLNEVAREVGQEQHVRTLVVNWWSYASDVTLKIFGEDGGHAGWNETAFIQAIDRKLVHAERYSDDLATPNPAPGTYSAYPAPSSIGLYKPGQGYVKFDQPKADQYFADVCQKIAGLVQEMKAKWDKAGL
ncbi:MAG TPA: creatininase family protein [Isosphaeraceae bacterium]|jgi:creatinine amidohydrolase|nr:creatininase family protein [Isosphaeraceae bacterium]